MILFAALGIAWGIPYLFIKIPFVLLTGAWPAVWPPTPVVVSIIVLAVVCSVFAFLAMVALVTEIGPVQATAVTYVNPAVAIIAGAVVLGERGTVVTIVGFALVLAGSYLVTRRRDPVAGVAAAGPEEAVAGTLGDPLDRE